MGRAGPTSQSAGHFRDLGAELGIAPEVIAYRDTLEERANLIRAAIGLRRLLIVVDDAWQIETASGIQTGRAELFVSSHDPSRQSGS